MESIILCKRCGAKHPPNTLKCDCGYSLEGIQPTLSQDSSQKSGISHFPLFKCIADFALMRTPLTDKWYRKVYTAGFVILAAILCINLVPFMFGLFDTLTSSGNSRMRPSLFGIMFRALVTSGFYLALIIGWRVLFDARQGIANLYRAKMAEKDD